MLSVLLPPERFLMTTPQGAHALQCAVQRRASVYALYTVFAAALTQYGRLNKLNWMVATRDELCALSKLNPSTLTIAIEALLGVPVNSHWVRAQSYDDAVLVRHHHNPSLYHFTQGFRLGRAIRPDPDDTLFWDRPVVISITQGALVNWVGLPRRGYTRRSVLSA